MSARLCLGNTCRRLSRNEAFSSFVVWDASSVKERRRLIIPIEERLLTRPTGEG